jgi:2-methylcitrate dehydratase PrpD
MTKYDHLGLMARAGIQAALLAQRGFSGDLEVLEGDIGFWRFAGAAGCDWDWLTHDLGSHWVIGEVAYKWFPTNHSVSNPTICLIQSMMREHGLRPEEVEHVEVRRGRSAEPPPPTIRNQMEAWMVPHYPIAAGIYGARPRRTWQEPETFQRADLLAMMQKVDVKPLRPGEVTTSGNYWEHFSPIRATIQARGQSFEGAQDYMPPTEDATLITKFHENVEGFLPPSNAALIEQQCWKLGTLESAREIGAALRVVG